MTNKSINIKRRLVINSFYSAFSWFLPLLMAFIVTPIIVRGLGIELYGLYAVILGFISYSFSFGIGKAAAKYVAEYRASNETDKISEAVSATLWFSLIVALTGSLVIMLAAKQIVVDILLISPDKQDTGVKALYLACVIVAFTMLSQVFQSIIQGLHRFDRFLLLTNLSGLILNVGNIIIVYNGSTVLPLIAWNLFVVFITAILFYYTVRRLLPEFVFKFRIRGNIWSAALKYGGSIILYQIFGNLIFIFERAWIVRKFGFEALTFYVVPMTLGMYLHAFTSSLVMAVFPVVNELLADTQRLVRLYQKATKLILALITLTLVSAIVGGKIFLALWISEDFATRSYHLLIIHMLTFALVANVTIVWQITESFRHAGLNAIMIILWFIISVPLMIYFSYGWQSEGIAIARLAGVIVTLPMILFIEKRFLGGFSARFWFAALSRLALAGTVMGLVQWIILYNLQPGWTGLFLAATASVVVFSSVSVLSGFFGKEERSMLGEALFGN